MFAYITNPIYKVHRRCLYKLGLVIPNNMYFLLLKSKRNK